MAWHKAARDAWNATHSTKAKKKAFKKKMGVGKGGKKISRRMA